MTYLLLFLFFTVVLAPLVDRLAHPLWQWLLRRRPDPGVRLRLLALRMGSALLLAGAFSATYLGRVRMAPSSSPWLPGALIHCLGHSFDEGPGVWTLVFMVGSLLLLGLVTAALFYPLPSFPRGERREDLEEALAAHGVRATVESLPAAAPNCWSEATPSPRVVLLGGIEELLDGDPLAAVLAHEAGHLAAGDHRHRTWARAYRRILFFFTGAGATFDAFVHEQERRADDFALARRPELAGSLLRALRRLATHEPVPAPAAGEPLGALGREAWSVRQRMARLAGEEEEPLGVPRFSPWLLLGTLAVLALSWNPQGACTVHCLITRLP